MSHRLRHHDEVVIDELRNPDMAKAYLEVALEEYELEGDLPFFLQGLRKVAEAQGGITKLSEKTSLNRQNLYRVLSLERKSWTAYDQSIIIIVIEGLRGERRSPLNPSSLFYDYHF